MSGEASDPSSHGFDGLHSAILSHTAKLAVVGLGYVGLSLAAAFAEAGFEVVGVDIDGRLVRNLNRGHSHVTDIPPDRVRKLVMSGQLTATSDVTLLYGADVISVCVPSPLHRAAEPDVSFIDAAACQIAANLRPPQLVILESTSYPGTTREILLPRLTETGAVAERDFFLASSPERIDPGNDSYGIVNTPKLVGGIGPKSTVLARLFYEQVVNQVISVSSPDTAEMAKLHENTFRTVNIALANEAALMCDRLGIDVLEVIHAASSKPFGFMPFYPGPGVGGHCIPIDPHYLSWKLGTLGYRSRLIEAASEINALMPHHVVTKVESGLGQLGKRVNGATVVVVGVAYKRNVADIRESPAVEIIQELRARGAQVAYHDPHVSELPLPQGRLCSQPLIPELLIRADCVVIVTDHALIDLRCIYDSARLVVDTRASPARWAGGAGIALGLSTTSS